MDTVDNGVVRAFEPRFDGSVWRCRGRVASVHRETDGRLRNTRQCSARLAEGPRFCRKCGGLIAWGGTATYVGVTLEHLDRLVFERIE